LALMPSKGEMVMAALADRFGITKLFKQDGNVIVFADGGSCTDIGADAEFGERRDTPPRGYEIAAGIAIIPITGTLVNKLGTLRPYSGMTGYDGIRANYSMALEDDEVKGIAFDMETPGGEVAGCFDLVDDIFNARGTKPTWAILSESAYSAGYAIASACDRIIVPRTGGTGSVGVICMHVDFSKALAAAGIEVTMITYGDRKADGNEYEPLKKAALERFQADVDTMGELFDETVARNRGMAASKVKATQALTFMGAKGVEIGFADDVMSPNEAFRSLHTKLSNNTCTQLESNPSRRWGRNVGSLSGKRTSRDGTD
ncbi:MAG TPA: S49 family peptidase, partial [Rhodocyclaceae bacterium]|nr:S49 family peptidase [Rhodocyclaceae bacterium]